MKQCLKVCPRINQCLYEIESSNALAGPLDFHIDSLTSFDGTGAGRLLQAAESTYDCATGPIRTVEEVQKGLFKKRTEQVSKLICGLEARQ
jgi:hypothetical protein